MIVLWKLDRLSRSLKNPLHIMDRIEAAGAGFRSLTETIDTTTAAGRMTMQMVGSFAEFERADDPRAHLRRLGGGTGRRRDRRTPPSTMAPLTPEAVLETVHLVAPMGILAVQGYAENVSKPWPGKSGRSLVFGDLWCPAVESSPSKSRQKQPLKPASVSWSMGVYVSSASLGTTTTAVQAIGA